MGSGTLDTYPLIADQTNATLGSELITNGDFATDSDWMARNSCDYCKYLQIELTQVHYTAGTTEYIYKNNTLK